MVTRNALPHLSEQNCTSTAVATRNSLGSRDQVCNLRATATLPVKNEVMGDPQLQNSSCIAAALKRIIYTLHGRGVLCNATMPCTAHWSRENAVVVVCRPARLWDVRARQDCTSFKPAKDATFTRRQASLVATARGPWATRLELHKYGRCAVVGNGQTLGCGSNWGAAIDSDEYDLVMRVNLGETVLRTGAAHMKPPYSCFAGSRVDMWIDNHQLNPSAFDVLESWGNQMPRTPWARTGGPIIVTNPRTKPGKNISNYEQLVRGVGQSSSRKNWTVVQPSLAVVQNGVVKIGGAGGKAVNMAMHLCEHVDAFGFGLALHPQSNRPCYGHYYADVDPLRVLCWHGHGGLFQELQIAVWDAFGLMNYIWW
mmetsp:Transcript_53303/g.88516  ORF Transcript_53303/g.88516 Transcript_53303/m.88516 type:complete len:368 (-) Transcript_53303:212-1315(-)